MINLRTARALGRTIPESLLLRLGNKMIERRIETKAGCVRESPLIDPDGLRRAIVAASALTVMAPLRVNAQSSTRTFRVGFLRPGQPPKGWISALERGLVEAGYVVNRNIFIEERITDGSFDALPRLAEELVKLKVDVIVASTSQAALVAQKVAVAVPVVFVGVTDPVGIGLVPNLSRPGGNLTGLAITSADLTGKRLQVLKEIIPNLSRVAIFWRPDNPFHAIQLKGAQAAATTLQIHLEALPVSNLRDFTPAFGKARGLGGLLLLDDSLFTTHRIRLAELALSNHLPSVYGSHEFVEAGGLLSYGADFAEVYRRAATYVDKILKGTHPGDLPVEQPAIFEMAVNLRTAKSLGVTIPKSLLLRADKVIE